MKLTDKNKAFFSNKVSRFSSHLTRLRVASNCISKYASKQTRQTRIEFTLRESPLSSHCPTIRKSATHEFVDMFYFSPDSLILFSFRGCSLAIAELKFPRKTFVHIHISKKKYLGKKEGKNKTK